MEEKNIVNNQEPASRTLWGMIADIAVVDFILLLWMGISINAQTLQVAAVNCFILLAIGWFYKYKRQKVKVGFIVEIILQIILFSLLTSVLNHFFSTIKRPLNDELFKKIDLFLGFDWNKGAEVFAKLGTGLNSLLEVGYISLGPQFFAIILILFISNHFLRLQQVIMAMAFSVITGLAFNIALPVANTFANNDIFNGLVLSDICYSAFAVIFMYAVYEIRLLRIVFIPLNILLITSTPIFVGHYVAISLAGMLVGAACVCLARKILPLNAESAVV